MSAPTCRHTLRSLALCLAAPLGVWAHGFKAGDMRIDHPYATPTLAGTRIGAVYFRGLSNGADRSDRLLEAQTAVAGRVGFHRMVLVDGVMRMREVDTVSLPPGERVPMRHDDRDGYHLMLTELTKALKEGDRFPLRLRFERAGWVDVMVWVQNPRRPLEHAH